MSSAPKRWRKQALSILEGRYDADSETLVRIFSGIEAGGSGASIDGQRGGGYPIIRSGLGSCRA